MVNVIKKKKIKKPHYVYAYKNMEFHSRRNVHELFQKVRVDAEEDVMESLKDDLEMMKKKFHENYVMTTEELVDIDFEICVTIASSDADISAELFGHVDINDEEESNDEEQPTDCILKPAFRDIMNAITVLEDNHLFSNFGADLNKALQDVNRAFDLDCLYNKKQSTIKDFFQKIVNTFIKKRQEE